MAAGFTMSKSYNVANLEKSVKVAVSSLRAVDDESRKEHKIARDKVLKFYSEKLEKLDNSLKRIAEVKKEISEVDIRNQSIAEKIKQEKNLLDTNKNRLESMKNENESLETEEKHLNCLLDKNKVELDKVIKEKKKIVDKIKKEIECFKYGVKLYESVLQLSMNIENKEPNDEIQITMKNLNRKTSYTIIFEECFKGFELIDIKPRCVETAKATELYHQYKSVPGLLSFLWNG